MTLKFDSGTTVPRVNIVPDTNFIFRSCACLEYSPTVVMEKAFAFGVGLT